MGHPRGRGARVVTTVDHGTGINEVFDSSPTEMQSSGAPPRTPAAVNLARLERNTVIIVPPDRRHQRVAPDITGGMPPRRSAATCPGGSDLLFPDQDAEVCGQQLDHVVDAIELRLPAVGAGVGRPTDLQ